jgi:hypothetical protein
METVRMASDGSFLFTEVPPNDEFELEGIIDISDFFQALPGLMNISSLWLPMRISTSGNIA